jgi:hypothetical protein
VAPFDDDVKFEFVCDRDDLVRLRDEQQNSWAKVAELLGLGSAGAARRVYSAVVRPHTESVLDGRTPTGTNVQPVHLGDADEETIKQSIVGRTLIVQRKDGTEKVKCVRVTSIKAGVVNFNDGNKSRSVKASAIIATK